MWVSYARDDAGPQAMINVHFGQTLTDRTDWTAETRALQTS